MQHLTQHFTSDVTGLIEKVARTYPGKPALIHADRTLSYEELVEEARALAGQLLAAGVLSEEPIGIHMPPGGAAIVTMLGILMAGGCVVYLDPSYPASRLRELTDRVAVKKVWSTQEKLWQEVDRSIQVLMKDTGGHSPLAMPLVRSNQLATIIFTSGSTGLPKAVGLEHRHLVRLATESVAGYLPEGERVAQASTLAFDASLLEIWPCLIQGQTLVGIDKQDAIQARRLREVLLQKGITSLFLTTSLFHSIVEQDPRTFNSLRSLRFGGEAGSLSACRRIFEAGFTGEIFNLYGPTEATVYVTAHAMTPADTRRLMMPLGKPVDQATVLLLDDDLQPVAPGSVGEIHIGDACVSRGYVQSPVLTADRFIPDPFASQPGTRLYRTGDFALVNADGLLEFHGRKDDLVKINGYRIELSDVEAHITRLPGVQNCCAVVREAGASRTLACYYTSQDQNLSGDALKNLARQYLPNYLLPETFIKLSALPLKDNGKVDRSALPSLAADAQPIGDHAVLRVLAEIIGAESLDPGKNFFECGGNSLAAASVIAILEEEFGQEIPITLLFEAPTIAAFCTAIDRLVLGEKRVMEARGPLTFDQEGLWYIDQLDAGDNKKAYLTPLLLQTGKHPISAIEQGLTYMLGQHSSLRTALELTDDGLEQIVYQGLSLDFQRVAVSSEDEFQEYLRSECEMPFDLARPPLFRARFIERTGQNCLLLVFHHAVFDGTSLPIFMKNFEQLLELGEQAVQKPEQGLLNFARWQRQLLEGPARAKLESYWRDTFRSVAVQLNLPYDKPEAAEPSFAGRVARISLPKTEVSHIKNLAAKLQTTVFSVYFAAAQRLVADLTGQSSFLLGTPTALRSKAEFQKSLGYFVTTLPVPCHIKADQTFESTVRATRDSFHKALQNRDLPFKWMRNLLPTLQLPFHFNFLEMPSKQLSQSLQVLPLNNDSSKTDITLSVIVLDDELVLEMTYASDRFEEATILGYLERYRALIQNPDAPRLSLINRFEQMAALHPLQDAIVFQSERINYAEAERRTNQIAGFIKSQGVQTGDHVAIYGQRSLELPLLIFGIMKAGAVYVPLDPELPRDRLQYCLDLAKPALLFRDQELVEGLDVTGLRHFPLAVLNDQPPTPLQACNAAKDGAYLLFTSGSTGKPKAVLNEHAGIENRVEWMQQQYQLTSTDRVLQKTPVGFDVSVWEFLWPLAFGATLVMAPPGIHRDPWALAHEIQAQSITVLHFVPTMLQAFLQAEVSADCQNLRIVMASGEALSWPLADRFRQAFPKTLLANLYGPTEAAIDVTYYDLTPEQAAEPRLGTTVPIGRPIRQASIHILDDDLQPVRKGETGELHIGGIPVSRGYVGNPRATATHFIPDPWAKNPGDRLYKTGDSVRKLDDQLFEFCRRLDGQIKLNGQRFEIGEIEQTLMEKGGYRAAVVRLDKDAEGRNALVAYLVDATETPVQYLNSQDTAQLRKRIQNWLPPALIPQFFIMVPQLPTTTNGKLDMAALPDWRELLKKRNPSALEALPAEINPDLPIEELIRVAVQNFGEKIAIESSGTSMTYDELWRKAQALAQVLRDEGIGPESRVAIHTSYSPAMIVAMLGTLMTGGAYLPVDPDLPLERIQWMLRDAGTALIIHDGSKPETAIPCRDLREIEADASMNEPWLFAERHPESLAYIMYTSGSTGQPKGALITRAGLSNYVQWACRAYETAKGKASLVHSPISFDLTVTSIYPSLLTGQKLVLLDRQSGLEGLAQAIVKNDELTLLKITPAHLKGLEMILEQNPERISKIQSVVIGGEALHQDSVNFWSRYCPEAQIINEYGPTETVVGCSIHRALWKESSDGNGSIPIGTPIANTYMYLLNEQLEPCGPGDLGQIFIAGRGVARGYHGCPGRTAESFLPDVFATDGARMYASGDLGRVNAVGEFEYLGRLDSQVKVRGYRIELGEIEHRMQVLPEIRQAVARLYTTPGGTTLIVGYYVLREQQQIDDQQLRLELGRYLPEYMIPNWFVPLESMPLTGNGKVDKSALPPPDRFQNNRSKKTARIPTPADFGLKGYDEQDFAKIIRQIAEVTL